MGNGCIFKESQLPSARLRIKELYLMQIVCSWMRRLRLDVMTKRLIVKILYIRICLLNEFLTVSVGVLSIRMDLFNIS